MKTVIIVDRIILRMLKRVFNFVLLRVFVKPTALRLNREYIIYYGKRSVNT